MQEPPSSANRTIQPEPAQPGPPLDAISEIDDEQSLHLVLEGVGEDSVSTTRVLCTSDTPEGANGKPRDSKTNVGPDKSAPKRRVAVTTLETFSPSKSDL